MGGGTKTTSRILGALGALFLLAIPAWSFGFVPELLGLPSDFRYDATLVSTDDFFDETKGDFAGPVESSTAFHYDVVSKQKGADLVQNTFEARRPDGSVIVSIRRLYGIDPKTGAQVPGFGDHDRAGYLFAPADLKPGQPFTYWHVNYDVPAHMAYAGEEDLFGLRSYRYETRYQDVKVDQTENLKGILPSVGVTRGIVLDPYLQIWVEPETGRLVKYQDRTTAYYYDLKTGARLSPWNRFENTFTDASVVTQVQLIQRELTRRLILETGVPALFGLIAFLFFLSTALVNVPGRRRRFLQALPYGALVLCLAGTAGAWQTMSQEATHQTSVEFTAQTASIQAAILGRLNVYAAVLRSARGLFAASDTVARDEWRAFSGSIGLSQNFPGIRRFGFAPLVKREDFPAFVDGARKSGVPDFAVWPSGDQPLSAPIFYTYPVPAAGEHVFGNDLYADPVMREAMQRALNNNTVAATGKVASAADAGFSKPPSFYEFLPVFKNGASTASLEDRQRNIVGFIYAAFQMDDLMGGALTNQDSNVDFELYDADGSEPLTEANKLYDNNRHLLVTDPKFHPPFVQSNTFRVGGHSWVIRYTALSDYGLGNQTVSTHDLVLWGGLLLSFLVFLALFLLSRSQARAERLADQMTADLREKDRRLVETDAKMEAILKNIGEGLLVLDRAGRMILHNESATRLVGIRDNKTPPKKWAEKYGVYQPDGTKLYPLDVLFGQLILKGKTFEHVEVLVRNEATGPRGRYIHITGSPLKLPSGKDLGAVIVFHDATKAKEIDVAKTEFVSLASHQLRTPLTAINWYAEMLLANDGGVLTKDQRRFVKEIAAGNKRMVDLVNALLNVSRLELGTFAVEPEPTDVAALAKSVADEQRSEIIRRKLRFSADVAAGLPRMNLDPRLMRIVLQNLLSNAVKYTPAGGSVSLSVEKKGKDLLVSVSDTGMGIPAAQQDKIFQKLFRADNVQAEHVEGTGLGLYVVKSILDHAHGTIRFESEENKGTTFFVTLPLSGMRAKTGTKSLS